MKSEIFGTTIRFGPARLSIRSVPMSFLTREHREVYHRDCFAGEVDPRIFPDNPQNHRVLDLGCGIGFWLIEFWNRGFRSVTGADLSSESLAVAKKRCSHYSAEVALHEENAESLSFSDGQFTHVNCQGVLHHTPNPMNGLKEIHRVLETGGTAVISVYYRNVILRNWNLLRPVGNVLAKLGARLQGRGREDIYSLQDSDDIVRHYDGADNPVGIDFSEEEFREFLEESFIVEDVFYHFFPARTLPFMIPAFVHKALDERLPFMIYAKLRKR